MGTVTNVPAQPLKWSIQRASREFALSIPTLVKRLNEAGEKADQDKAFATGQLTRSIFGDLHAERLRKTREEGDKVALANQITRGEFLNRYELENMFSQIAAHIKTVIRGSGLTRGEQDDVLRAMSAIQVRVADIAERQRQRGGQNGERGSRNGDGSGQNGQKRKRKPGRTVNVPYGIMSR